MTTQTIDPTVVRRLQALLALGRDTRGSEAEAQLAMERAQEIMRKHNLTMATVEASGGKGEERVQDGHKLSLMFPWQRELLKAVAKANFCHLDIRMERTKGGERIGKGYDVIGRQSNVIAMRNMYDYLIDAMRRIVLAEAGPGMHGSKFAFSFRKGCAERLGERLNARHQNALEEQRREAAEEQARRAHPAAANTDPTFHAPVVILSEFAQSEDDLNHDVRMGWEPGTTARRKAERHAKWQQEDIERKAQRELFISQGHSSEIADYLAAGYTLEEARKFTKPRTAKQQERDERRHRRYWDQQARQEARERAKLDLTGYRAGRLAGDDIGLDAQVTSKPTRRLA